MQRRESGIQNYRDLGLDLQGNDFDFGDVWGLNDIEYL